MLSSKRGGVALGCRFLFRLPRSPDLVEVLLDDRADLAPYFRNGVSGRSEEWGRKRSGPRSVRGYGWST